MIPEKREQFLSENVEQFLGGITYMQYWKGGRSQATINEEGTKALVKLQTLFALEREVDG